MTAFTVNTAPDVRAEERQIKSDAPLRVCFVCTGNTCRSPMAEAVANHYAKAVSTEAERPAMLFRSAGLYAHLGDPISQNAVQALELGGILPIPERDYHVHRAHTLTEEEAERFDLLVGLSEGHAMELLMRFPALASRITVLSPPVSDPYGGDLSRYQAALRDIVLGVRAMFFSASEDAHE